MTEKREPPRLTRRHLLAAGGTSAIVAGAGASALWASASADEAPAAAGTDDCLTLTKETIEGPYYLDYDKHRADVTEHKPGVPVTLRIRVLDGADCTPLTGVAVDIWHCDAVGVYSSYEEASSAPGGGTPPTGTPTGTPTGAPTGGPPGGGAGGHVAPDSETTYLRGFQMTDKKGWVRFRSVFPGWYAGRAVHIHVKVHTGGAFKDGAYADGTTVHTGQLFFPEGSIEAVAKVSPYAGNTVKRVRNEDDMIYSGDTAADGMLALTYDKRHVGRGVQASITMAVDPDTENRGRDGGGGPAPSPSPS